MGGLVAMRKPDKLLAIIMIITSLAGSILLSTAANMKPNSTIIRKIRLTIAKVPQRLSFKIALFFSRVPLDMTASFTSIYPSTCMNPERIKGSQIIIAAEAMLCSSKRDMSK